MSEGVHPSEGAPFGSSNDARLQSFFAGGLPIAIGLFSCWAAWSSQARVAAGTTVISSLPVSIAHYSLLELMLLALGSILIIFGAAVAWRRTVIPNQRDYYGGLALILLAVFALWASADLPGMRGFAFGPGTAPRMFAGLLGALGVAVTLVGLFTEGAGLERYAIRGPLFITVATLIFAFTIRQFGLVIASYVSLVVSALGTSEFRWLETLIWAGVLTGFCVVLFPIALNLPLQLWPTNLSFANILNFR